MQEANLPNANLGGADLRKANLRRANLNQTDLRDADLRGADLQEATLQAADLSNTRFRDANLQNANLENAKGFQYGQLGGANLTGAILPPAVAKFDALANVEELSQSAKKLFITMLGACVYSWLTIATTTDVRLITNSASSPLPIIQTPVPIVGFYVAAPLLILCLYLYFHFYMQRLWESLADLPAFFPDGAPLDKKAHPWLLNGLVRSHFALLKKDRPALSRLQVGLASLMAWWVVPLTQLLFWERYLSRYEFPITILHIALFVISIGTATWFSRSAARTLADIQSKPFNWKNAWKEAKTYKRTAEIVSLAIALLVLSIVSFRASEGIHGYWRADLTDADVSTKPEGWTGREQDLEVQFALVKGARLRFRNLRGAQAGGAFLVKADFVLADLRDADLFVADLQGAYLVGANLWGANVTYANLQGATLVNANLREANLFGANLQGADLPGADLPGADLRGAEGLLAPQVKDATNWESAAYSDELLNEQGLLPDHNGTVFEKFPLLYNPDGTRKPL